MQSFAVFMDEPLGRMLLLAVGSVMIFIGLQAGGFPGIALAVSGLVPIALMFTGGQPLLRMVGVSRR